VHHDSLSRYKTGLEAQPPLTYTTIKWLKKKEQVDVYDYQTDFNPFAVAK
jgi:hypothetical protein